MRFLVVLKHKFGGVSYHRLVTPFRYLERLGHKVDYIINFTEKDIDASKYDYLVYNRSMGYGANDKKICDQFRQHGCKVIVDIDDYWNLPEHHTIVWREDIDYELWRSNIIDNVRDADFLWTSTLYLKDKISKLNKTAPIALCKNAIDYDEKQWCTVSPLSKKVTSKVNIGYVGSTTHHMDLDPLKPVFRALHGARWLDEKILWHLIGTENTISGVKVWQRFADIVSCNKRYGKNVRLHTGVRVNQYAHHYDLLDVSIASVLKNEFNAAKSELKIIEAGAKKVPFIGTDYITYSRTDANVDLCNSTEDWIESIKELTLNKDLRISLGEELHDYVRTYHRIEVENEKRLSILK